MKNAIFTGSRKNKLASRGMISVILIFVLFLAGCFDFEFVNQPFQADPNSSFEVQISAWAEPVEDSWARPYFGILLPAGWEVEDSIEYVGINHSYTGMLIHSDSLSQTMASIDPPQDGYYWWVAAGYDIHVMDTYVFDFHIFTDNQTGTFFLDYMLGSDMEDYDLNYRRSNEHLIIVGGVILSNQSDIDNFPINFPNCGEFAGEIIISGDDITNLDGLNALTSISGSLWFIANTSLTSLTGMVNLTSIGGTFSVNGNQSLHYIQGLNNLTSVGRNLLIEDNTELINVSGMNALTEIGIDMSLSNNSLISFTGMNNLLSIGRDLIIDNNDELNSLIGMNNLTSIGGDLSIRNNTSLNNLTGLNNLTSIGGYFDIYNNTSLTSLFGLENMTSIGGYLNIYYNDALNSLTGLEGLTSIGGDLTIRYNPLLCNCEVDAICAYLAGPTGTISIYGNASGCSSLIDVAVSCGTTLPCLEEGTYYLYSQFDVDHFPAVFPGCTEILCNIVINGDDITNLDSLAAITSIVGQGLSISSNDSLISLTGLEGLTSIGGSLLIQENAALDKLTGLEGLTSIGSDLRIQENAALVSLTGLESLTSIGSNLRISSNDALSSLAGLEGLTSVGGLSIYNNDALSSLAGLEGLTSIEGYLNITYNTLLADLMGLEGLTSIGGYLKIGYNSSLTNLAGLEGLSSVGEYLYIYSNPAVTSLSGLNSLTSIGGYFKLSYNSSLANLSGLESLTYIGDYLSISSNASLTSLTGLDGLASIDGNLLIYWNPFLNICDIDAICAYLADTSGTVNIYNNAPGCDSEEEVEAACLVGVSESAVSGQRSAVRVYPNPVSDKLSLDCSGIGKGIEFIEIYNVFGARVGAYMINSKDSTISIDVSSLPAGIYICRVHSDIASASMKFIKY